MGGRGSATYKNHRRVTKRVSKTDCYINQVSPFNNGQASYYAMLKLNVKSMQHSSTTSRKPMPHKQLRHIALTWRFSRHVLHSQTLDRFHLRTWSNKLS
jgi:hypothetical protein